MQYTRLSNEISRWSVFESEHLCAVIEVRSFLDSEVSEVFCKYSDFCHKRRRYVFALPGVL